MSRGPKGEKRPADVIGNAVKVMRIAVGEEVESELIPKSATTPKRAKGGLARAAKLTAPARSKIALKAAKARWGKTPVREKIEH